MRAGDDDAAQKILWDEEQAVLLATLQTLADDEREMIILRYILSWRVNQIAEHFGLKENTGRRQNQARAGEAASRVAG